jgi:hypothetical protein
LYVPEIWFSESNSERRAKFGVPKDLTSGEENAGWGICEINPFFMP